MLRKSTSFAVLGLIVAAALVSSANAAITGMSTLKANPDSVPFASPDAALASPWKSYSLDIAGNAGEVIAAVDVTITGALHQRWTFNEDSGSFTPTPNTANQANGDSHLRAVTGAIFGAGPTEDNPGTGSPLPSTAANQYGVGTTLSGAWGIPAASQGSTASLAYLVIRDADIPNLNISVKVADGLGNIIADLDKLDFFGGTPDLPIVGDLNLVADQLNETVTGAVALTNVNSLAFNAVNAPDFDPLIPGKTLSLPNLPTLDNAGNFSWNTSGAKRGTYEWAITGTGAGGATDGGLITVEVQQVPEPATLAFVGLALVGVAGVARKRS